MALRANNLTSENKRRTLQRNDIAMAVSKTDTYDFLIDIVPRDEVKLLPFALFEQDVDREVPIVRVLFCFSPYWTHQCSELFLSMHY